MLGNLRAAHSAVRASSLRHVAQHHVVADQAHGEVFDRELMATPETTIGLEVWGPAAVRCGYPCGAGAWQ